MDKKVLFHGLDVDRSKDGQKNINESTQSHIAWIRVSDLVTVIIEQSELNNLTIENFIRFCIDKKLPLYYFQEEIIHVSAGVYLDEPETYNTFQSRNILSISGFIPIDSEHLKLALNNLPAVIAQFSIIYTRDIIERSMWKNFECSESFHEEDYGLYNLHEKDYIKINNKKLKNLFLFYDDLSVFENIGDFLHPSLNLEPCINSLNLSPISINPNYKFGAGKDTADKFPAETNGTSENSTCRPIQKEKDITSEKTIRELEIDNYKRAAGHHLAEQIWTEYQDIMICDLITYSGFNKIFKFHYDSTTGTSDKNTSKPSERVLRKAVTKAASERHNKGGTRPKEEKKESELQLTQLEKNVIYEKLTDKLVDSVADYFPLKGPPLSKELINLEDIFELLEPGQNFKPKKPKV